MKTATVKKGKKKTAKEGGGNTGLPAPTAGQPVGKWVKRIQVRRNDDTGLSLYFETKLHPSGEARCRVVKRNQKKDNLGASDWVAFKTGETAKAWVADRMEEAAVNGYVKKYRTGSGETVEIEDLLQ